MTGASPAALESFTTISSSGNCEETCGDLARELVKVGAFQLSLAVEPECLGDQKKSVREIITGLLLEAGWLGGHRILGAWIAVDDDRSNVVAWMAP